MKIYSEISLRDFDFWSGAVDTVNYLTDEELDELENILITTYSNGMDETELNDFFRFEDETIAEWLGFNSFDEIVNR